MLGGVIFPPTRTGSDRHAPSAGGNAPRQDFINAAAVEIDHLETPALAVNALADLRQMPELAKH